MIQAMDDDDYGDIADEDLIEAFSQTLPVLPCPDAQAKRRRASDESNEGRPAKSRRNSQDLIKDGTGEESGMERDPNPKITKRNKKFIHIVEHAEPITKIIGATQAEALPDSSPWRIRGPIYRRPRPDTPPIVPISSTTPKRTAVTASCAQNRGNQSLENDYDAVLNDLPSDAFSSPEHESAGSAPLTIGSSPLRASQILPRQRVAAVQQGLRQTTLFGDRTPLDKRSASQFKKVYNYKVDQIPEAPTHHALDLEALRTWVYPTNLGTIRDYQYNIVKNGLFHNILVALPTGLGKTFVAATIMLNYFRWMKDAQIVFVAPTKPLVSQQVEACFNIVGIPRSQTTMLTGEQAPALRAEEWADKRVFFMTPQTLENDLSSGIADPKKVVLLVVDEAHRATGNYAYVKVVSFLRRFNRSFRVLALTATPGSSVEAVQEVIDNMEISKVEIRTEESLDIQQYIHKRDIDQIMIEPSDEIIAVQELLSKALQPLVDQLCSANVYWNRDPMSLTTYALLQAGKNWSHSEAGRRANPGLKWMIVSLCAILASVAHAIKLLQRHGIGPFYSAIKDFRQEVEDSNKPPKYKKQIVDSPDFKKMMDRVESWINKDDFIGHPKMSHLCDTVLNHFLDAGEGQLGQDAPPSTTRVIVFSEYRDSAEEITRVLNRHRPMIRAAVFVGQADSKRSEGMNQAAQLQTIQKFKDGTVNVIVATSIGEEGLDIGQVDLIVCYDSSASPIRMLQRMGRTGRKRAGKIVLLLMKGKERDSFAQAKDSYEQMQKLISAGTRFNFRHDLSVRIIPRDITPVVDKRMIDIPIENTQNPGLPEPKRRPRRKVKKPDKKFHMPDDVETGFTTASNISSAGKFQAITDTASAKKARVPTQHQLAPIPSISSVLLTLAEEQELEQKFQNIAGSDTQEVSMPELTTQTVAQRTLRPVGNVAHGNFTKRCVEIFRTMAKSQCFKDRHVKHYENGGFSLDYLEPPTLIEESKLDKNKRSPQAHLPATPSVLKSKAIQPVRPARAVATPRKKLSEQSLVISNVENGDKIEISGDESEGEGYDLMRTSEPSEDGSDNGEDMRGFIASESSQTYVISSTMRSSTTPLPTDVRVRLPLASTPYTYTQESENDLAEVKNLGSLRPEAAIRKMGTDTLELDDAFRNPYISTSGASTQCSTSPNFDDIPVASRKAHSRMVVEDTDSEEMMLV